MSSPYEKLYHVFQSNGTIAQVEHVLNAVATCPQLVSVTNGKDVVVVHKKVPTPKLQEDEFEYVYKITDKIYMGITGVYGDVIYIVNKAIDLACELEYKMGCEIPPGIFIKEFATEMQVNIQTSRTRLKAFSMHVFGLVEEYKKPSEVRLYHTDLSAYEKEVFACTSGEDSVKMTTYLEKTFDNKMGVVELIKTSICALLESIGKEAEHTEMCVYVFNENGMKKLEGVEVDKYLQDIAEQ